LKDPNYPEELDRDSMGADMAPGMVGQCCVGSRDGLVDYAVEFGIQWALPRFLELRGRRVADWKGRWRMPRNRLAYAMPCRKAVFMTHAGTRV
jgi:hypothetical protein